jgi:hypothetical protein
MPGTGQSRGRLYDRADGVSKLLAFLL